MRPVSELEFEAALDDIGSALVAAHVATAPLRTAHVAQAVSAVRAWAEPAAINNVPVVRDGRVVGVLENVNGDYPTQSRPADGRARDRMRQLEADMLLEGRTPLRDLIEILLRPPHYRLVLDRGHVGAIVTPSDLVKLPMRVLVFGAVAQLEQAMLDALRRLYTDDESALETLEADSQAQVLDLFDQLRRADLDPSLLEVASLKQKGRVLAALGAFGDAEQAVAELDDVVEALRNPLMHAAGYVDDSIEALRALDRRLRAVALRTQQAHAAGRPPG